MNARVMKWLRFPQSGWLAQYWWHRLATVVFWAWGAFWVYLLWGYCAYNAWQDCNRSVPADGDVFCGSNPWSGLLFGKQADVLPLLLITTVAGLFLPTVLYRISLFVVTGDKWKN